MNPKTCSIDGCNGRVVGWGLCAKHWQRQNKNGTTDINKWAKSLWTPEELEILHKEYPVGGKNRVHEFLPHRTKLAIQNKANTLRVRFTGKLPSHTKYSVGVSGQLGVLAQLHKRAKIRGKELSISDDEILRLSQLPCHYCGAEKVSSSGKGWGLYRYNGIDRLDNTKGYIPGNVVPCCRICNRMKMEMPVDQFISHVRRIAAKVSVEW